jgi:hypothetical protein
VLNSDGLIHDEGVAFSISASHPHPKSDVERI